MLGFSTGIWTFLARFRKRFMSTARDTMSSVGENGEGFDALQARMVRYDINWSYYQNTCYDETNRWLYDYKVANALPPSLECLFNPVYRCVEFWATHLMGGALDPDAGPGDKVDTAIPIKDADDTTRKGIAKLWSDSEWEINKSVWCRFCAGMGDVGLEVINDPTRDQVRIRVVDPRTIARIEQDSSGATKYYEIVDFFIDPRVTDPNLVPSAVQYREVVDLVGGRVRYRTFLNEEPYAWYQKDTWFLDQPDIPMVFHCHTKVSVTMPFGFAEMHPALPKIRPLNDMASRLHSQIKKYVDTVWLFCGVSPEQEVILPNRVATDGTPQPTDSEVPALYGPADSKAQALVSPLDIEAVLAFIAAQQEDLKEDYPELRKDIESALGDASGTALRVARQRCEAKANSRRPAYDSALTKIMKIALAMGSRFGYDGYQGLPKDASKIKFRIGTRSVFATDPLDKLELDTTFWMNAESAERAGLPLPGYLKLMGWDEGKIKVVMDARQEALDANLPVGRATQASPVGDAAGKASQAPGATAPNPKGADSNPKVVQPKTEAA
jgi:hypothetical protein